MKTKNIQLYLFAFVTAVLLFSCADSAPVINSIQTSVVFEFKDDVSLPEQKLSLFIQTDEINRVEKIRAEHIKSGLEWNIFNTEKINTKDNKKWAGYTKLVPASGSTIPVGKYSVRYTDASDKECESFFIISYPNEYAEKKASDFPAAITDKYSNYLAIYAADGTLIAYERNKSKWTDFQSVKNEVPMAAKIRRCYIIDNGSIIIMMPFETNKPKQMETKSE